jgi:predicted DNA-binding transcriptional regulator AlpA
LRRTKDLPPLVGINEVATIFGIDRMTFYRWQSSGYFTIEPAKVGRTPVWTRDDIEEFAERRAPRPHGPAPSKPKRKRATAAPA